MQIGRQLVSRSYTSAGELQLKVLLPAQPPPTMTTRWPGLPLPATVSLERKPCLCCCSGFRGRCELAGEDFALLAVDGPVLATA